MRRLVKAALAATVVAVTSVAGAGTASAHFLGGAHWAGNGYGNPHVWIADYTGSIWPVSAATSAWNQGSYLDVYYKYNSCGSTTGEHCVGVYDYDGDSSDNRAGYAGHVVGSGHYSDTGGNLYHPYVELNSRSVISGWTITSTMRRHTACQEIGHAFGLDHQYEDTSSCMNDTWATHHDDTNVGSHSWDDLHTLYGHVTSTSE